MLKDYLLYSGLSRRTIRKDREGEVYTERLTRKLIQKSDTVEIAGLIERTDAVILETFT